MQKKCPLCNNLSSIFYKDIQTYHRCLICDAIFVSEEDLPDKKSEKERYELHDSDTEDIRYRKFVSPITKNILCDFTKYSKGLDFGAGTSAIISVVLKEQGYNIVNYDPYFHNYPDLLNSSYDYVSSCEVIEHFYNPQKEFKLLYDILNDNAKLYLMTDIYDDSIEFSSWYYKNDPTHVFLYTKKTFQWIKKEFNFKDVELKERLIIFSK